MIIRTQYNYLNDCEHSNILWVPEKWNKKKGKGTTEKGNPKKTNKNSKLKKQNKKNKIVPGIAKK